LRTQKYSTQTDFFYLSQFKAAHRLQRIFWFGKAWRRKHSGAIAP